MNVKYTNSFQENVLGTVEARFKLDASGAPLWDEDEDGRCYFIDLRLKSPNSDKIDKVTYVLNPSYTVPSRFSSDRDNDFVQEISAFGDYVVTINVQAGKHLYVEKAWLSALLKDGHGEEVDTGPIRDAIAAIKRG
jgi:hypothetical protein